MFADDTKIFREIKNLRGVSSLQKDLGKLVTWSQSSGLLLTKLSVYGAAHKKENKADLILLQTQQHRTCDMLQKKIWAYGLVRI